MVADRGVSWVVMADRRVSRDVVANRGVSKRTEELFERFVVVVGMSVAHLAFLCTRPLLTRGLQPTEDFLWPISYQK